MPGADMNPYFALSAIFGLGLRGIERRMRLEELGREEGGEGVLGKPIGEVTEEERLGGKVRSTCHIGIGSVDGGCRLLIGRIV